MVHQVAHTVPLHRILLRISLASCNAFVWILITKLVHGSLWELALLFVLSSFLTVVLTPLTARLVRRGLLTSMMAGVSLYSLGSAALAAALGGLYGSHALFGALAFVVCLGIYRSLYWVPYRTISKPPHPLGIHFFSDLFSALAPLFAGYIIAIYGAAWLLWGAAALAALSLFALAGGSEGFENYQWSYAETLRELFSDRNRGLLLLSIVDGVQGAALFFLWPLTVFILMGGNMILVGTLISITLLITIAVRLTLRYLQQSRGLVISPFAFSTLTASTWLMRLGVATPLQVVSVDVLQNAGSVRGNSIDVMAFEQAADRGHMLDEYSALKEMGMALGRTLLGVFVYVFTFFYHPVQVLAIAIVVAAFVSFSSHFIKQIGT